MKFLSEGANLEGKGDDGGFSDFFFSNKAGLVPLEIKKIKFKRGKLFLVRTQ